MLNEKIVMLQKVVALEFLCMASGFILCMGLFLTFLGFNNPSDEISGILIFGIIFIIGSVVMTIVGVKVSKQIRIYIDSLYVNKMEKEVSRC